MHFKRLLNSVIGRMLISILLGLGLATLFRKACTDKNCIQFNGPVINTIDGKTYQFGEKCYQYKLQASTCDSKKRIIDIASSADIDGNLIPNLDDKGLLSTLGIAQGTANAQGTAEPKSTISKYSNKDLRDK